MIDNKKVLPDYSNSVITRMGFKNDVTKLNLIDAMHDFGKTDKGLVFKNIFLSLNYSVWLKNTSESSSEAQNCEF